MSLVAASAVAGNDIHLQLIAIVGGGGGVYFFRRVYRIYKQNIFGFFRIRAEFLHPAGLEPNFWWTDASKML